MRYVSLASFLPHIMPYAPTAPEPMVIQHLRMAAREFCKETLCWREVISATITENPFEINVPAGATIVSVQSAKFNERDLRAVHFNEADIETYLTKTGRAEDFTQDQMDRFIVMPFEAGVVTMSLYLAPSAGTVRIIREPQSEPQNQIPAFLFDEYAEGIAHGALARLLAIPAQEWTNGSMAAYFAQMFEKCKGEAAVTAIKGKQRAPIRTKARWM